MVHPPMAHLDAATVLTALHALRHALPLPTDHPLASFLSIQQGWVEAGRGSSALTELIVFEALKAAINHRLRSHRAAQGLSPVECRGGFLTDLRRDFQAGNTEREAWSLLYYRFIQ